MAGSVLDRVFLWKGAGLCSSRCSLPAASLIHIPELKPSLLPAQPLLQGLQEGLWLPEAPSQTHWPHALCSQLSLLCLLLLSLLVLGFLMDPPLPLPSTSWLLKCSSG